MAGSPVEAVTNCIGSELGKIDPVGHGSIFTPLAVKATMKIWAPLQWKGGQTVELYKGKLDRLLCGNFRDITLGDRRH